MEEKKTDFTARLLLAVLSACFGSVGIGCVMGYSGIAVPQLQSGKYGLEITREEGDWFGSVLSIGALLGALLTGTFVDRLGRKTSFIIMSILLTSGNLIISFAVNFAMLISGRLLTGFCSGLLIISVPIYCSELSPPRIRGLLSASAQLSFTFGILFTFALGYFISWSYLAVACGFWSTLMALFMFFMPESPSWLVKHERFEEALAALKTIRPATSSVEEEFAKLQNEIKRQESLGGSFEFSMLKNPTVYKPLLISIFLMIAMQLTGINAIIFNVVFIFQNAGSTIDPLLCTIIIGLIQFVATFVAVFFMDRFGRRVVLLSSSIGMFLSHAALGIYYALVKFKDPEIASNLGWIPLVCLIVYMISFVGFGLGPWVIIPEISPFRVRGFICSVANVIQYISIFILTKEFSLMVSVMGNYGVHFFYAGCVITNFGIIFAYLPETKGLSFREIEEKFETGLVFLRNLNINMLKIV